MSRNKKGEQIHKAPTTPIRYGYKGNQKQRVSKAFYEYPKTMLMVAEETNILRANICRFVSEFRKSNSIRFVKLGICPISKHKAGFFTTNLKTDKL